MLTLVAFIVTIGMVVTIHEFGHFQVARWCGVKVLRFSIGFGKPIWRKTFGKDKTEFVLAAIPLGGYVKMLDEREIAYEFKISELKASELKTSQLKNSDLNNNEQHAELTAYSEADLSRAFNRQSVWKRIAIVAAGPVANLLLAIFIYWALFMSGVTVMRPLIGAVTDNSAAAQAHFKAGELIKKIDGVEVKSWQDVRWILIKKSFASSTNNKATLQVEVINHDHELRVQTLGLTGLDKNDFESDIVSKLGFVESRPKIASVIGDVVENSVAQRAGLRIGDEIKSVNHVAVSDWGAFVRAVRDSPNQAVIVEVARKETSPLHANNTVAQPPTLLTITLIPERLQENGKAIGRIGVAPKINTFEVQEAMKRLLVKIDYSPSEALAMALNKTWDSSIFSLKMLAKMVTGQVSLKGISGPATIASYAGQSADLGVKVFLGFLATISISIGVLNLLPIPVLDGGHLMYYVIEIFKGSPVSDRIMEFGQRIGFAVLGLLMTIAIFNDITRFSGLFAS